MFLLSGSETDIPLDYGLRQFQDQCLADLKKFCVDIGVLILSFDIMARSLDGTIGENLERSAEQVITNQIKATQVEITNRINLDK